MAHTNKKLTNGELLVKFRTQIYDQAEVIDPYDKSDWYDLAYGFFLALDCSPKQAEQLAIATTCFHMEGL